MSLLSASEAAARLGVKRETLYAYVSRGVIQPIREDGSRLSLFDPSDVEALRSRRRRLRRGELDAVVATRITLVEEGNLRVRGEDLIGWVLGGAGFEAVADRLWDDEGSGGPEELWPVPDRSVQERIENGVSGLDRGAPLLDRLRTAVCALSAADPLRAQVSRPSGVRAARGLISALPLAMELRSDGSGTGDTVASRLWDRCTSMPGTVDRVRALDGALALLADHGLATSTFAARVAASVRADVYSIVLVGMGAVAGALHGGASGRLRLILESAREGEGLATALEKAQVARGGIPGFGHSVYREGDPREKALMTLVEAGWSGDPRLAVAVELKEFVETRTGARANIDYALAVLTWLGEMERTAGEAIFAIARTAGWIAHGLEEWEEEPLRFRPRARYVGRRS